MNNSACIILLGWQFSNNTPQALKDKDLKVQLQPLALSL